MPKPRATSRGGLTRKLLLGFGGVLLVMLVVAGVLIGFLSSYSHELETVLRENYDSVVFCSRMTAAIDDAQAMAQMSLSQEKAAQPALEVARTTFEANALKQLGNTTLPGEGEKSRAGVEAGQKLFAAVTEVLGRSALSERQTAYQANVLPEYQRCRALLGEISEMNLDNLAKVNGQVRAALLEMRGIMITLLLAGLALSVLFVLLTAQGIIRPLMQLTASVRQIEGGNLESLVQIDSHDEIGQLGQAFNEMAEKLREYRRLDQQKLVRSEQTTQAAIDSLPDAVAVLDAKGNIEIANRTALVHFKLQAGANIYAVRPDWAASFLQPVLETGRAVAPDGYRSAIQLFDESGERFLLPRAVPMHDAKGTLIGVTLVLVEVTHLRKADEFKSGLLATVSHELKTPLTSIRMAIRLMLDRRIGDINERQQALLAAAKLDSERLVRTVEDILTIDRVEAGRARLELANHPAAGIAHRAIATVDSAAAERQISLVLQCADPLSPVFADLNLIACALSNLLSNAIKFSPAGSTVYVDVSEADLAIKFKVRDEGPGIPEEYRTRIFEKFFRIPGPGGPSGAGLGLSIAAEIVHLHGGTIAVVASTSSGSTFLLGLPIHETPKPSQAVAANPV